MTSHSTGDLMPVRRPARLSARPSRHLAAVAGATTLGLAAAVLTAAPATAAPSWATLSELENATLQACKVSVDDGNAWRVRLRLRNGNDYRVRSTVTALRGGEETDRVWKSGWVRGGDTQTGQLRIGTGRAWDLSFSVGADQFGGGGTVSDVRRC